MDPIRLNFATHKHSLHNGSRVARWAILALLVVVSVGNIYSGIQHIRQLAAYRGKVARLESQVAAPRRASPRSTPSAGDTAVMEEQMKAMARIVYADVFPWTQVLSALEVKMPIDTRIEAFKRTKADGRIRLDGSAETTRSVSDLIQGLDSQACFADSRLLAISIQAGKPGDDKKVEVPPVRFEIETKLVPEALFPGGEYDNTKRYLLQ